MKDFINWLNAEIDKLDFFIGQVIGIPYKDDDDVAELAKLQGELDAYKKILAHLLEDQV